MPERVATTRLGPPIARVAAPAAALGLMLALAACGGGGPSAPTAHDPVTGSATRTSSASSSSTTTADRHRHDGPAARVRGAAIGTTQSLRAFGAQLHVTVTAVRALARGDASPPPGDRGVGVAVRIADEAGQTYDSTASGDLSVIVSSGMAAPLDVRSGPCETQLVDFESHLYSGDVRTGCVGFSLPRHARVIGVRFSPHARRRGSVTWRAAG